jgi:hypothetical protein
VAVVMAAVATAVVVVVVFVQVVMVVAGWLVNVPLVGRWTRRRRQPAAR